MDTENNNGFQSPSEGFRIVQNDSEDFSNVQKASERASGIGRGKKYPGAEVPEGGVERANYSLVMEEVYERFEDAGERRSMRMIAEYCKSGELVCYYDSDDKRWHITPESVESKIEKIKALNARKEQSTPQQQPPQGSSEDFRASQNTEKKEDNETGHGGEESDEIRQLRAKNRRLRVNAEVNRRYIERLEMEREKDRELLLQQSRHIGVVETEKKQLVEENKRLLVAPRVAEAADTEDTPAHRNTEFSVPGDTSDSNLERPIGNGEIGDTNNVSLEYDRQWEGYDDNFERANEFPLS